MFVVILTKMYVKSPQIVLQVSCFWDTLCRVLFINIVFIMSLSVNMEGSINKLNMLNKCLFSHLRLRIHICLEKHF